MSKRKHLKTFHQYLLPQHGLSRLVGRLAESETPWIKKAFIGWFKNTYSVDLSEALIEDPWQYKNFNAFFTRELKPDARPLEEGWDLLSPVDCEVSQIGRIDGDTIFQAKGHEYSLNRLVGDESLAEPYRNGSFATLYLSPRHYHRIHAPIDARLLAMTYIPGQLFSVNHVTASAIPNLFARNERLVVHLETDLGPMAMVLVGATIVASIETVWAGIITPSEPEVRTWTYELGHYEFLQAEEMARFRLGSTVIMLTPENSINWRDGLKPTSDLLVGQGLANKI